VVNCSIARLEVDWKLRFALSVLLTVYLFNKTSLASLFAKFHLPFRRNANVIHTLLQTQPAHKGECPIIFASCHLAQLSAKS
jgi:hypothetical protein